MPITDQTAVLLKVQGVGFWKVVLHHDAVTETEFVVEVLQRLFGKSEREAEILATTARQYGSVTVGSYLKDIAMTRATRATLSAATNGFPLRVIAERE